MKNRLLLAVATSILFIQTNLITGCVTAGDVVSIGDSASTTPRPVAHKLPLKIGINILDENHTELVTTRPKGSNARATPLSIPFGRILKRTSVDVLSDYFNDIILVQNTNPYGVDAFITTTFVDAQLDEIDTTGFGFFTSTRLDASVKLKVVMSAIDGSTVWSKTVQSPRITGKEIKVIDRNQHQSTAISGTIATAVTAALHDAAQQISLSPEVRNHPQLAAKSATSGLQNQPREIAKPDLSPSFLAQPDADAIAIVIGIEKYQSLPAAGFSRSDALLMRDYLKAMGYQERNIELLTDERATFSSIRKAVETWLPNRINAKSRVTVYYAGHGAPDPQTGDAYIVPYDGDPNYLPDTGYPLKRLYERLEKLSSNQIVVMIDACFSGAGGRGVLASGSRSLIRIEKTTPKSERIAVLTSTQGSQISTSSPEKQHGLFTYYLVKALQESRRDLSDVYEYLRFKVEDAAKRMNVEQTPSISPDSTAIKGKFKLW